VVISLSYKDSQMISTQDLVVRLPTPENEEVVKSKAMGMLQKIKKATAAFIDRAAKIFLSQPYGRDPEFWNVFEKMQKTFTSLSKKKSLYT